MGGSASKPRVVYTEAVQKPEHPGETPVYRRPGTPANLRSPHPSGAKTIIENFEGAVRKFGSNHCLGTRSVLPNGELGAYSFKTYSHVQSLVYRLADSLRTLVPRNDQGLAILGLYSINREEWLITDLASAAQDITTVPLYDTLGIDNIEFIIDQTQMTCVAAANKQIPSLLELKKLSKIQGLTHVIHFEMVTRTEIEEAKALGITLLWYVDLINDGLETNPRVGTGSESVYTICYTSGTTGRCKGVIISNENMVESIAAVFALFHFDENEAHLSYLPLAHIMERIVVSTLLACGTTIAFFGGNVLKIKDDLAVLKPTLFVSVPRLFSRLHEAIEAQFKSKTGIAAILVNRALSSKTAAFARDQSISHRLWDLLVFRKVQNSIGGKVKFMLTGSAPITQELVSFIKIAFSCPVVEGYGQTESCGASLVTSLEDNGCGYVGGPLPCLELKLVAVAEMRYFQDDVDEAGRPAPRGELCLRGPQVFKGYYKQPDLTAAALDSEGWLHTGDIVVRLPLNGAIKIIDRKKNIFKLAQGEYVAVEKIESSYSGCPFINQIFVYGDSYKSFLVAIVVPNEAYIRKHWCPSHSVPASASFEEICLLSALKSTILDSMNQLATEQKVLKLHLHPQVWTSNDLLTPTQKLKRFEAKEYFQPIITQLYA